MHAPLKALCLTRLLHSNNQQQTRELMELLARAEVDESDAFSIPSFSTLKNVASIGDSTFKILKDVFGGYVWKLA